HGIDWSLFASHEMIEMLCDRDGDRTADGPSLDSRQGRVKYLVEVCDPCQHSTYTINGVLVSDFVTPGWYDDPKDSASEDLYSFTGGTRKPRQLWAGGYVTGETLPPDQNVWQAIAQAGNDPSPRPVGDPDPVAAANVTIAPLIPAEIVRDWI